MEQVEGEVFTRVSWEGGRRFHSVTPDVQADVSLFRQGLSLISQRLKPVWNYEKQRVIFVNEPDQRRAWDENTEVDQVKFSDPVFPTPIVPLRLGEVDEEFKSIDTEDKESKVCHLSLKKYNEF